MNTTLQQDVPSKTIGERKVLRSVLGGSLAEGITGGATIVLALIGLSHIRPEWMLPTATITMGAAFLLEGGAVSMRFSKLLSETTKGRPEAAEFGFGVTAEFLGGITGMVLGILALLGLSPDVLVPVAIIVFGSTLLLSSGVTVRLNALELEGSEETERFRKIAREAVSAAAGVQFLLGLGAIVLGIIALATAPATTLGLVALLIVGITGFLDAAAVTARMVSVFRG